MSTNSIPFLISKKEIILNFLNQQPLKFLSKGHKNEFETVVVNEPSGFEPLMFYCNSYLINQLTRQELSLWIIAIWLGYWQVVFNLYKTPRRQEMRTAVPIEGT